MMGVDGDFGRQETIPVDDFFFRLAPGTWRMAAWSKATVIPCLIRASKAFEITIHWGEPIPAEMLTDPGRLAAAKTFLVNEFLKVIRKHPEQCSFHLVNHFDSRSAIK